MMKIKSGDAGTVKELSLLLEGREEVKFAYLFGSRAMGHCRPDSDLDLAVFFDDGGSVWDEMELEEELSRSLGIPVQVVSLREGLTPRLLHSILLTGVMVKDGPGRVQWEEDARKAVEEEAQMEQKDPRKQLLDSIQEKAGRILKAIPLLDEIDLERVRRDEPEVVRDFLGACLMLFEPLETIARRVSGYARLALGIKEEPTTLQEQMKLMLTILDLDEGALTRLEKFTRLRHRIAHAYWKLAEEEFSQRDLEELKGVLERIAGKLSVFVISERGKLD